MSSSHFIPNHVTTTFVMPTKSTLVIFIKKLALIKGVFWGIILLLLTSANRTNEELSNETHMIIGIDPKFTLIQWITIQYYCFYYKFEFAKDEKLKSFFIITFDFKNFGNKTVFEIFLCQILLRLTNHQQFIFLFSQSHRFLAKIASFLQWKQNTKSIFR